MTTPTLREILNRLLDDKEIKVAELARATGVPQPTLHRLAAGTSTKAQHTSLTKIAAYFEITIDQLMGIEPITWLNDEKDEFAKKIGLQRVPLLNWENVLSWLETAKLQNSWHEKIVTDSLVSEKAFALTMLDSAMFPAFPINTQAVFDPYKPYKDRSYVLVKLCQFETPIFRQLLLSADQSFVKPLSPDLEKYNIQLLSKDDKILATLVEAKVKFTE